MSVPELTLVVLAAGAGSRYGGLKQLTPIGVSGETLLEYSAFDALRAGFDRIVLVIRPETEQSFRDRFRGGMDTHARITYVHQRLDDLPGGVAAPAGRSKPWGTGHAVLSVASEVDGPFAVVNADDFYGAESYVALANFLRETNGHDLAAVGFRLDETLTKAGAVSRAVLKVDIEGHLQMITELPRVWSDGDRILFADSCGEPRPLNGDELVSMNMWGFTPTLAPALDRRWVQFFEQGDLAADAEFLLPEALQCLVSDGEFRVHVLSGAGRWCGITFREDERQTREFLASLVAQGNYPSELWSSDRVARR